MSIFCKYRSTGKKITVSTGIDKQKLIILKAQRMHAESYIDNDSR
jgi:hypothetical protein